MSKRLRMWAVYAICALCVLGVIFAVASFTGQWPWARNGYNSYTLQALSWLQGRLDLGQDYPWLELAIYEGRYYVSFPPFPSAVMLPFAAIFGENTPDGWIALAVALIGVWHACALCRHMGLGARGIAFWTLALMLSNGILWIQMNGYVWFIAQSMCVTLCLMALDAAARGRGIGSLTAWACAVGCRPTVIVFLPILLILLWENEREAPWGASLRTIALKRWYWAIPTALIAASYMALNYARFGSVLEFGHNYLPEFQRVSTGQFDLSYLWPNVISITRFPSLPQGATGTLGWYTINGGCFYLVNPFVLVGLAALVIGLVRGRDRGLVVLIFACCAAYTLLILCHRTLGGWHFGNRYLLETMPFLLYGILRFKPKGESFALYSLPYILFCAAVNLIGTTALYARWL